MRMMFFPIFVILLIPPLGEKAAAENSPLKCSVATVQYKGKVVSCSITEDNVRVTDVTANRGRCRVPEAHTPEDEEALQSWIDHLPPRDKAKYVDNHGNLNSAGALFLIFIPISDRPEIRNDKILQGAATAYSRLEADPRRNYEFGDNFQFSTGNCNLLEYTVTANGTTWKWGAEAFEGD